LFFPNRHAEITILGSLHPRMPKESIIIRAMASCRVANVSDRNKAVSRKFLYQLDHIPARNMELFGQMIERRPCVTLAARKVSQISVELLGLFGDFWPFLKPSRHPHAIKKAVRINEFCSIANSLACYDSS